MRQAILMGMFLCWSARADETTAQHTAFTPAELTWGEAPPKFVKGAKMSVLFGDPTSSGEYVVRLKVPANYRIMPHWHPTAELVTVIEGSFGVGMGDKLDPNVKQLPPGSFVGLPANMHHFALAKKASVVQVSGMGPFTMTYVNPADDPSGNASR
jgi:quercetin dioxygenase-like cupin family protein